MKKTLFIPVMLLFLFISCEKEEDNSLNIIYTKSENASSNKHSHNQKTTLRIGIYPNPFLERVNFFIEGDGAKELIVTNDEGKFQKIPITNNHFILDFSNEKKGSYYCEIKVGDVVFREHLRKAE